MQLSLPEQGLRLLVEREIHRWEKLTDAHGAQVMAQVFNPPTATEERTLRDLSAAIEARLAPASREEVIAHVGRLAAHDTRERPASEWRMVFEDFAEDLAEFSGAHVRQAVTEHRRTNKWFPKVSELRERCLELRALDTAYALRCRRSLGLEG